MKATPTSSHRTAPGQEGRLQSTQGGAVSGQSTKTEAKGPSEERMEIKRSSENKLPKDPIFSYTLTSSRAEKVRSPVARKTTTAVLLALGPDKWIPAQGTLTTIHPRKGCRTVE
jgi:sarcosine oxidase gamma subunit